MNSYVCAHCGQIYDPGFAHVCRVSRLIAEALAARDKWWVTEIDKHLKQFQGYEYIDNEWWQSLKQSLDTNWCDPTCELYDGRMCDVAEHCNRRQAWKKSLEVKE